MNTELNDNPKMQSNPPPYTSEGATVTVVDGVQHGVAQPVQPTVVHAVQPTVVHTVTAGTTVVQTNMGPMFIASNVGPNPVSTTCKSCGNEIVTRIEKKASLKTHLLAAVLCLLGCWCCVCIPYCKNSCYNADHYCPSCNAYIGSYRDE